MQAQTVGSLMEAPTLGHLRFLATDLALQAASVQRMECMNCVMLDATMSNKLTEPKSKGRWF